MSGESHVNVKSQSELDIGGRETCYRLLLRAKCVMPVMRPRSLPKKTVMHSNKLSYVNT